jgi:hypothetical protein
MTDPVPETHRRPCPVCVASVKAENLAEHLRRKHPGEEPPPWPRRLTIEGDRLRLRTRLWRTRTEPLDAPLVVAGLTRTRGDAVMSSYADDYPGLAGGGKERAGLTLAVGGIVVGCASSTGLRKHWTGFADGKPRGRAHVMVSPPVFVALQYALAERGALTPR